LKIIYFFSVAEGREVEKARERERERERERVREKEGGQYLK
jgi:hypothetical protein